MGLAEYHAKRSFVKTPEPRGRQGRRSGKHRFVVQKHDASRLHYDFRLEVDGVLKSWAVPKGPSLDPGEKRLAVQVEDHPLDYADFEGNIPPGEYGGGTVIVWDRGEWTMDADVNEGLARGRLKFKLRGEKLKGGWNLVRLNARAGEKQPSWLLIKERDEEARAISDSNVLDELPQSVKSGRTLDEVAATAKRKKSTSARGAAAAQSTRAQASTTKRRSPIPRPARSNARQRSARGSPDQDGWPDSIAPQLATLSRVAPGGENWLHEIKFDGYRILASVADREATLWTRGELDWSDRFPTIARALSALPIENAWLDGELVAVLPDGRSSFQSLQNALSHRASHNLLYYLFDVPYLDGADLRSLPLQERKERLAKLLARVRHGPLRLSEYVDVEGPAFFKECCALGLEGIVSKRRDRPYLAGRGLDWLKTKCIQRDEFVIGGYTDPGGSRQGLGALLLGYYPTAAGRGKAKRQTHHLCYAGKVGTGFSDKTLSQLLRRLRKLSTAESPFQADAPRISNTVHWVRPELVAEIEYTNWTEDGRLRHPSFQGLREDKPAAEVARDEAVLPFPTTSPGDKERRAGATHPRAAAPRTLSASKGEMQIADVRLTNPDRLLYPDDAITKRELAEYLLAVSDRILPHLQGRPLALVRCPDGYGQPCFFQKHARQGVPSELRRVPIKEKNKTSEYLAVDNESALVALAQLGVLEIHPWGSREDNLDRPDRIIFDLDPDPAVDWKTVVESAREMRELLRQLALESFVKTTGGKGLHVVVPLVRRAAWPEVKQFTREVAELMSRILPERYVSTMSKTARRGKIFVDYLRNDRGSTSVAAYSTRARPGAPVSVPLAWEELSPSVQSDHFRLRDIRLRLRTPDPWSEMADVRQSISAAARTKLRAL